MDNKLEVSDTENVVKKKRGRKPKVINTDIVDNISKKKNLNSQNEKNSISEKNFLSNTDENDIKQDVEKNLKSTLSSESVSLDLNSIEPTSLETKKKRGRKPKNKTVSNEQLTENPEKKKRGRKPKIKNPEDENVVKVLKKRGRKPKEQVCNSNINKISNTFNAESENIIIHLPIKNTDVNLNSDQLFEYTPEISSPKGFEDNIIGKQPDNTLFISQKDNKSYNELCGKGPDPDSGYASYPFDEKQQNIIDFLENDSYESNDKSVDVSNNNTVTDDLEVEHRENWYKEKSDDMFDDANDKVENIMDNIIKERKKDLENVSILNSKKTVEKCLVQFDQCNNNKSWPSSTSVYCWWCCHPFSGSPCALPYNVKDGVVHVTGIFCSPECAAAYNFDDVKSGHDLWERYSLLNYLYRKVYNDNKIKIKLAPSKQCLKIFGGNLTIKEFRLSNVNYSNSYKIIMPPMISVIPIQEIGEIDKGFSSNVNKVYLIDRDKLNDSELRLKRTTPYNLSNNTLQKCMNISTNTSVETSNN